MKNEIGLVVLCLAPVACHSSSSPSGTATDVFAGTWNYDLPNGSSGEGVATVSCPASPPMPAFVAKAPQVGNVVLTRTGDATMQAKTDQGCTWTFALDGANAELSPPSQTCFNEVIGSSYTLTRWSISIAGTQETETLAAKSHLAADCDFTVTARRTKVDPDETSDPTEAFIGSWAYDAPDPQGTNLAMVSCAASDGGLVDGASARKTSRVPETGRLTLAKSGDRAIRATTADGCTWDLNVAGNTAELASASAACAAGGRSLSHWAMASDGQQIVQVVSGSESGCGYLLSNSKLSKASP